MLACSTYIYEHSHVITSATPPLRKKLHEGRQCIPKACANEDHLTEDTKQGSSNNDQNTITKACTSNTNTQVTIKLVQYTKSPLPMYADAVFLAPGTYVCVGVGV
jgi:hypothetical protein